MADYGNLNAKQIGFIQELGKASVETGCVDWTLDTIRRRVWGVVGNETIWITAPSTQESFYRGIEDEGLITLTRRRPRGFGIERNPVLEMTVREDARRIGRRWKGSPTIFSEASGTEGGVDLAAKYIARAKPVEPGVEPTVQTQFVDSERLSKLRGVASEKFDLAALVRMCEELNACWQNGCYYSVAALGRTILNHVPPVFGCSEFRQVCAQHGGKSVKATLAHLRDSLRNIADHHLHAQIGRTMALPNAVQVDFRASLDVLLGEVVKKLST